MWSPDGASILYHYTKFEGESVTNNIALYSLGNASWKTITSNFQGDFGFIDSKNVFTLSKPMVDSFDCDNPSKIDDLDTKQESPLIGPGYCYIDFFASPKSRWATYSSATASGFVNMDTKETFPFNFGPNIIEPGNSFSNDGKFFYGFANDAPDQISKVDLNAKK